MIWWRTIGAIIRRERAIDLSGLNNLPSPPVAGRGCGSDSIPDHRLEALRLDGKPDQVGGALEIQLLANVGVMHGDSFGAQVKLPGDFLG